MSATTAIGATRATAPSPVLIATLGLLAAFPPFAVDMYLPGFPELARDLRAGPTAVQVTITALLLGIAVGQFLIGPLAGRAGRRRTLLGCLAVCALAGAVCALAPGIEVLVGARFVQGLAGSAGVVVARAVVSGAARGREAARVFGVLTAVAGVAPVAAPLVGALVIAVAGWRGVFWALAVLALLMFLAAWAVVPEPPPVRLVRPADQTGTARTARALLRDRAFAGYALTFTLAFGALMAYIAASPFVLRTLYGLSMPVFALAFAVIALAMLVVGTANARLVYRHPPQRMLQAGVAVLVVASAVLGALAVAGLLPVEACLPLLLVAVASLGLVMGNATTLALGRAPHATATASGMLVTLQYAFGALVAPLTGLAGPRSIVPMGLAMAVCAVLALVAATLSGDLTARERLNT
ncbi:multidrug effflux MFS transporter [Sphaerisporangium fuscum]|uniref:multidrug effflux MFS transporter n=1 Tax=Sphaerisporangium fuscum TaxID=2835868 RepID=UPI001BDBCC8A|nr:multidrug effflux MFS transporter [Sphaerisporangium fuscum]